MVQYDGKVTIELTVNGERREATVRPADVLLDVLRDRLGLTGAKAGCKNGDCGVCTVLVDGWPVKSCLMLAVEAVGHTITTVEGLHNTPLQKAFVDKSAFQCGYCTSGFLMVMQSLLLQHPDCDENTLEQWLQSNLCRCTSYAEIREAAQSLFPNAHTSR
ncbi:(2Fe-2S)-binding protein [Feifania hominis]|uniref:(2Fe-2S)-binding protein n=1 Tax=Feifania hominis TaxID=2763660 RepID=A0A926HQ01_9FIRM|nr:(2Fe-2S)-binding protein [Feifania hominis]MBC8535817.1 (2Fe-2S)-binding protein [Feifania hominis]